MSDTDWSGQWYPATMKSLLGIAGYGFDDENGQSMPNLSSIDTLALLGLVTPGVINAIERFNEDANSVSDKSKAAADNVNEAGNLNIQVSELDNSTYVDAKTYLQYQPDNTGLTNSVAWIRFASPVESYQVYWLDNAMSASSQFQLLRQLISDWQRMVSSSSSALLVNSANTTAPANQDDLREFLSALRSVCGDFDVLSENPPELGNVTEALRYALSKSSDFVGKAAAEISNEVGKQAGIIGGNITGGFLANAGILSFVVVGLVIHLYIS